MNPSPIAREYLDQGFSATCPLIDVHGHLGPFYGCYLPSAALERMRHRLKRCGVRRIVCSHHSALAWDAKHGNALMQEVVAEHPHEFLGYWVIKRPRGWTSWKTSRPSPAAPYSGWTTLS